MGLVLFGLFANRGTPKLGGSSLFPFRFTQMRPIFSLVLIWPHFYVHSSCPPPLGFPFLFSSHSGGLPGPSRRTRRWWCAPGPSRWMRTRTRRRHRRAARARFDSQGCEAKALGHRKGGLATFYHMRHEQTCANEGSDGSPLATGRPHGCFPDVAHGCWQKRYTREFPCPAAGVLLWAFLFQAGLSIDAVRGR